MTHAEVVRALSTVEELTDLVDTLSSSNSLTGKILARCDTVEKLETLGFGKGLIAEAFLEDYLASWRASGVPLTLFSLPSPSVITSSSPSNSEVSILI